MRNHNNSLGRNKASPRPSAKLAKRQPKVITRTVKTFIKQAWATVLKLVMTLRCPSRTTVPGCGFTLHRLAVPLSLLHITLSSRCLDALGLGCLLLLSLLLSLLSPVMSRPRGPFPFLEAGGWRPTLECSRWRWINVWHSLRRPTL